MKTPSLKIVIPLLAVAILAWLFRVPLREQIRDRATLANNSPAPEVVSDMINQAADPGAALLKAWNSWKIVHREVAIDELRRMYPADQPLPPKLKSLLVSAALDPDMNVRENALGALQARNDSALTELAAAQLGDADPQLRLLGVRYLKHATPSVGVPLAAGLLDDPDLRVVGMSAKLLENWSGENFGIKLADTVLVENNATGLQEFPAEGLAKTRAAAEKAKAWWMRHQSEYAPLHLEVPAGACTAQPPVPADDFQLRTLDGKRVKLSNYRGKIVLINFWTTWCTACVSEIKELNALQSAHADNLVVIGVSLDSVPDEGGDVGGDEAGQKLDPNNPQATAALLKKIRDKVIRTVIARGINYSILLDEHNEVGGRFNGGELPTTVIVDAQGNVRRRFVGARSLPVFEAMIAEARQPAQVVSVPLPLENSLESQAARRLNP